ncbi:MAG: carboxypeptidase-like regulatory domain-containing protein, partial [Dehalococcoidales bacterium]
KGGNERVQKEGAAVAATGCESGRGSIGGRMFDEDGRPVAGVVIRAERSGDPGILLRTDEDGYYRINNVDTGRWQVEFYDADGWQAGLETVTVRANETVTLNFTVGEKPLPDGFHRGKIINAP